MRCAAGGWIGAAFDVRHDGACYERNAAGRNRRSALTCRPGAHANICRCNLQLAVTAWLSAAALAPGAAEPVTRPLPPARAIDGMDMSASNLLWPVCQWRAVCSERRSAAFVELVMDVEMCSSWAWSEHLCGLQPSCPRCVTETTAMLCSSCVSG